jgi:D-lyxose ketol-isomerase
MISRQEFDQAQRRARDYFDRAGIVLTPDEAANIEVADFGLGALEQQGLQLLTYVNTERVCAKELVLFPRQTCPEHRHPPINGESGKEETFRCRWGEVFLYVSGPPTSDPRARPPHGASTARTPCSTRSAAPRRAVHDPARHAPLVPGRRRRGVVSEFSTRSRDEFDVFTDPAVERAPIIAES